MVTGLEIFKEHFRAYPFSLPSPVRRDLMQFLDQFPPTSTEWGKILDSLESRGIRGAAPVAIVDAIRQHFELTA